MEMRHIIETIRSKGDQGAASTRCQPSRLVDAPALLLREFPPSPDAFRLRGLLAASCADLRARTVQTNLAPYVAATCRTTMNCSNSTSQ
jgi:hypothetical protein